MVPKISVIIPVYNAEAFLKKCLDSVTNQDLTEIEIICIDDGSTDDSLKILKEYQQSDARIVVINQDRMHAGIARNNGLSLARGEFVHFLDADDWVGEGAYRNWYAIAKDRDAEICACLHKRYNNETKEIRKCEQAFENIHIFESSFFDNPKYYVYNDVVPWNKLYNRDFLLKHSIRFNNLICGNDRSFYFQSLLYAKRIVSVPEYWIYYRVNNKASLIGLTRQEHYSCHFSSFEIIWGFFSSCDDEIKRMVLDVEMTDFIGFYKKAVGGEYEREIRQQLGAYLSELDMSLFGHDVYKHAWYEDYLELCGFDTLPEYATLLEFARKEKEIGELQKKNEFLQRKLHAIQSSKSYRIGRAITFPVRMFRNR